MVMMADSGMFYGIVCKWAPLRYKITIIADLSIYVVV